MVNPITPPCVLAIFTLSAVSALNLIKDVLEKCSHSYFSNSLTSTPVFSTIHVKDAKRASNPPTVLAKSKEPRGSKKVPCDEHSLTDAALTRTSHECAALMCLFCAYFMSMPHQLCACQLYLWGCIGSNIRGNGTDPEVCRPSSF